MKNIGKYNGVPCYTCSDAEYKNAYKEGLDDGRQIFIVDGTMVKRNMIVGHYDGTHVRDVYDGVPYIVRHEPGPRKDISVSDAIGTEIKEIVYSDYSKVVDEFFENLPEEMEFV